MNVKLRLIQKGIKLIMIKYWYMLMKPVANLLDFIEDYKYKKTIKNVNEDKVAKLLAKDFVKRLIRFNRPIILHIAEHLNTEDTGGYCLGGWSFYSFTIKDKKLKTMYRNIDRSIEFQEKVVDEIRGIKGVEIEMVNFELPYWTNPVNYKHTYEISLSKEQ